MNFEYVLKWKKIYRPLIKRKSILTVDYNNRNYIEMNLTNSYKNFEGMFNEDYVDHICLEINNMYLINLLRNVAKKSNIRKKKANKLSWDVIKATGLDTYIKRENEYNFLLSVDVNAYGQHNEIYNYINIFVDNIWTRLKKKHRKKEDIEEFSKNIDEIFLIEYLCHSISKNFKEKKRYINHKYKECKKCLPENCVLNIYKRDESNNSFKKYYRKWIFYKYTTYILWIFSGIMIYLTFILIFNKFYK